MCLPLAASSGAGQDEGAPKPIPRAPFPPFGGRKFAMVAVLRVAVSARLGAETVAWGMIFGIEDGWFRHDRAGFFQWSDLGRERYAAGDIGLEDAPVHRAVDDEGRGKPVTAQAGDERLRLPMSEGSLALQALSSETTAPQPGHLRGGSGFVNEDKTMWFKAHAGLALCDPAFPRLANVRPILFAGQQRFF